MLERIKKTSKVLFTVLGGVAILITIGGFVADTWQKFQGDWQEDKAVAWIFNEYNFEFPGWAWIGLFSLTVIFAILIFLFCTHEKIKLCKDPDEIKLLLERWLAKWKTSSDVLYDEVLSDLLEPYGTNLASKYISRHKFYMINFSKVEKQLRINEELRLRINAIRKYLQEMIKSDGGYEIIKVTRNFIKFKKRIQQNSAMQRYAKLMTNKEKDVKQ